MYVSKSSGGLTYNGCDGPWAGPRSEIVLSRLFRVGFTVLQYLMRLLHVLFGFLPRESVQASDEMVMKVV